MEYKALTDEHRAAIQGSTLLQIEQEHYANTLALRRAEASENQESAKSIKEIISSLEKQHAEMTK